MNDQGADGTSPRVPAMPGRSGRGGWSTPSTTSSPPSTTASSVPLLLVARAIVFGIIVATMALIVSILLSIAVVRLLDVYAFRGRVWASDALVGGPPHRRARRWWLWTKRRGRRDAGTS
jgi:hypothetical protein